MKRTKLHITAIAMGFLVFACSKNPVENLVENSTDNPTDNPDNPNEPKNDIVAPAGWKYYGGDEFDADEFDTEKWLIYGTPGSYTTNYGRPDGMLQSYRPEQLTMAVADSGEKVVRITSEKRTDGNMVHDRTGWWSGAFGSREAEVFYPLFYRVDMRAKVASGIGIWHGIWSRHYKGASTAELDLTETFVKVNGENVVSQAIHLWNNNDQKTEVNVPRGQDRRIKVDRPAEQFHIYTVLVERVEGKPYEAKITYMIDEKENYSFITNRFGDGIYNKFITDVFTENRTDRAWDIVFTGGIGGKNPDMGYPNDDVEKAVSEIDYVRVFVKE